jgi:hypothetical protein
MDQYGRLGLGRAEHGEAEITTKNFLKRIRVLPPGGKVQRITVLIWPTMK